MHSPERSFQKTLGLSIAVHIAVFGSALAFAHYGGPLFGSGFRSIMVSLAGPGAEGVRGNGRAAAASVRRPAAEAAPRASQAADRSDPALPTAGGNDLQQGAATAAVAGTDGDREGSGSGPETAASAGTEALGYSPEQWRGLQSALERAKTYPRLARERGIEGTVLVRFHVLPSGKVDAVNVVKSSGAKVLDDASVRTVLKAAPVPFVEGWVEVPMVYELKD